jgi:hypothetical protein
MRPNSQWPVSTDMGLIGCDANESTCPIAVVGDDP